MRTRRNRVTLWALIILLSLVISFFIDIFFLQLFRLRKDHLNINEVEMNSGGMVFNQDGTFRAQDENVHIAYTFPESYVYKVTFETETEDDTKINFEMSCPDTVVTINEIRMDTFSTGKKTLVIDAVTDQIDIFIWDIKPGSNFDFKLESLDYKVVPNPIRILSTFICCLMIGFAFMYWRGYLKISLEKVAVIFTLVFGLLLAYITPPGYGADEFAHLIKAFNLSHGEFYTEMTDFQNLPEGFTDLSETEYRSYEDYQRNVSRFAQNDARNYEKTPINSNASAAFSYTFIPYIFSAIGIKIAELLRINLFYWPFVARIFNVAFFAFALYWSIKVFPTNKLLMFFFAMLPIMFNSSITVGTSTVLNSCLLFALAYFAMLMTTKRAITWIDYGILLLLFFIVTNGRMPYGLFTMLLVLLPKNRIKPKFLRRFYKIITVAATVLFMAGIYFYSESVSIAIISLPGVDADAQMEYIFEDLGRFINNIWTYSVNDLFQYGIFNDFGYVVYNGHITQIYFFFAGILFIYLALTGRRNKLIFDNWPSRILVWILFMLAIAISEASIYITHTKVGLNTIEGFQQRYVISILLFPFLTFESKNFYLVNNREILKKVTVAYSVVMFIAYVGTMVTKFYR